MIEKRGARHAHRNEVGARGLPGLRFLVTGLYMFFSRTRARDDAYDRSAYFLALSVMVHAILAFITFEYARNGPYYFSNLARHDPYLKVVEMVPTMVLYLGLAHTFKRLVPRQAVLASAQATRPAVGVTRGVLVFLWTLAVPFVAFLVLRGTFGPVFHWLGPPKR